MEYFLMVYPVQKRWMDKNINLEMLIDAICGFFKDRNFEVTKFSTESGYKILAKDSTHYEFAWTITLTLEGEPGNFTINLELSDGKKRPFPSSIAFTTMFGGGYFLVKQLKSDERWIEIRRDLWAYIDATITNLTCTANTGNVKTKEEG
jgi:hypothetical protein